MDAEPDDPFASLTPEDRTFLFDGAELRTYHRGEVLFHEGAAQPNLYFVKKGLVRVERNYQGRGLAVARYGPGEVLGEIAFLEQQPAFGSAVAEEEVEVQVLKGGHIHGRLGSDSGFASRFYHSLAVCLGRRLRQITPGIQLPEAFGGVGRRPRLGQLSERQFPPDLTAAVADFWTRLRAVDADLRDERLTPPEAQARVNGCCDDVIATLHHFTQDKTALLDIGMNDLLVFRDMADLARGVGSYVFRETYPFFTQSATIAQALEPSRGYTEDREVLAAIERDQAEGDGRLGPLIDRWFLDRPLCRARRNSLRLVTGLLKEAAAAAPAPPPVRLTSLVAGTAREVFDLLAGTTLPLYVTCIDNDADTLLAAADEAKDLGCSDRITFLQADLAALIRGQGPTALGPQHVIYGLGVCDYLTDDLVGTLLNWVHGSLAAGGWVILTNRDADSPDRALTEHILDWPVIHRTAEEFANLFAASRFGVRPEIQRGEAGVNLLARCRKP